MLTVDRRPVVIGLGVLVAIAAATVTTAIIKHHGAEPAAQPAAPKLETRVAVSGNIPTAQPADFAHPIAIYVRHVRGQLRGMESDVARMRAAIERGDRSAARRAWLAADGRYESIGAAYGAFGALDAAINGLPGLTELPVLGALFRSRDYVNGQTELVVLITPYIVRATAQRDLSRPDDGFTPAADPQALLLANINRLYGAGQPHDSSHTYRGRFGFITD